MQVLGLVVGMGIPGGLVYPYGIIGQGRSKRLYPFCIIFGVAH